MVFFEDKDKFEQLNLERSGSFVCTKENINLLKNIIAIPYAINVPILINTESIDVLVSGMREVLSRINATNGNDYFYRFPICVKYLNAISICVLSFDYGKCFSSYKNHILYLRDGPFGENMFISSQQKEYLDIDVLFNFLKSDINLYLKMVLDHFVETRGDIK